MLGKPRILILYLIILDACADQENFRRGWGVLKTFLVINVFHRGPYEPPSRNNWTQGVQFLLEKGLVLVFLDNIEPLTIFQGWGFKPLPSPLGPPMLISAAAVRSKAEIMLLLLFLLVH